MGVKADRSPRRRLELERLEDRVALATNISIITGAAGAGTLDQFLSATQGTITTADDPGDTAATLSTGALASVNSTTNISIAADATISFNDLGGTLSLQTGLGNSAAFTTTTGAISFDNTASTLATTGGSIGFSAGTSLAVGNLNTGGGDASLKAGGDITLAVLNAGTGAVNVKSFAGSILDGNGSTNNVTGGAINLSAGGLAGINVDVITNTPATAGVTATTTNGNITLRSTQQLQVDSINAGTTNDVSLTVNNANTATSSITSLHPNDGIADVTGRTVTLTATGPSNGATGQIGFSISPAADEFFEVAATTINASTNNSRLWISAIGGAAIGSISAGGDFAILKSVNGDLTSTHTGSTPDITASEVDLVSAGLIPSSFGSASNPLLVQTATLQFDGTDTGSINVTNVAAGGDLAVMSPVSDSGENININVAGGNLVFSSVNPLVSLGGTVTLNASGSVLSPMDFIDVQAANLAVTAGAGVGTFTQPLKTELTGSLAANGGTGGVFITDLDTPLDIGTVAGVSGVTTGGDISITTNNSLIVSQPVSATGVVALGVFSAANQSGSANIKAPINGASAAVLGGFGNDVFTVTTLGNTRLDIEGEEGTNTLNFDGQSQHAIGTLPFELTTHSNLGILTYFNIQILNLNNASSVDAFYGPDTADRGTALPGLTAAERFVQVLYLNALGRAGSKAEIDGWAAAFGGSSASIAPVQAAIARAIEGSMEGRDHEVKSWYVQYLGRAAAGGEEMAWVNMLMAGQTEESVLSQILGSSEFFNHAQTLGFSGTADSQYVQALYELIMHRAGSAPEVAGWVGALPTPGQRGAALDFLDSGEFRTDQFEGYYNALLHRPSDSAGLNGWLASGLDVFNARVNFETSSEFFSNG
jgi:hypothetical protein